TGLPSAVAV
ncbi:hypothetical protein D034_1576B, partial [Vibrio parahaemolyticus Peru-288]